MIVDALDEHIKDHEEEDGFRIKLVDKLQGFQVTPANLSSYSILLTSQDYLTIQEQLQLCRRIEIRAQEADNKVYLALKISVIRCCNPELRKIRHLVTKC